MESEENIDTRHLRFVELWLAGFGALCARLALFVPVEGVKAHGEAEGVQDLVFDGAQ